MLRIQSLKDIYQLVTKRELSVMEAVDVAMQRARRRKRWRGTFLVEGVVGGVPLAPVYCRNALYNQGEQDLLELFFQGANATQPAPTDFKVGLLGVGYALLETDTMPLVAANELGPANASGYSTRGVVARSNVGWPTSTLVGGDWQVTSAQVTWTAAAAWIAAAGAMFLMSGGNSTPGNTSGRVIAAAILDPTRQLQAVNDNLRLTYNLKLQ